MLPRLIGKPHKDVVTDKEGETSPRIKAVKLSAALQLQGSSWTGGSMLQRWSPAGSEGDGADRGRPERARRPPPGLD